MIHRFALLMMLAACSAAPVVDWPAGPPPATPALLPTDQLQIGPAGVAEAAGAALAAEAEALKARAALIGTD